MENTFQLDNKIQIYLGDAIFSEKLQKLIQDKPFFLCLDKTIDELYGETLLSPFKIQALDYLIVATDTIEESTIDFHTMLRNKQDKSPSHIIAIGGGMIGDITNSIVLPDSLNTSFIYIPTTFFSQVDNFNITLASQHPQHMIIDMQFLESLSERLFKEGFVALVKYGLIGDATILTILQNSSDIQTIRQDRHSLLALLKKTLIIKKNFMNYQKSGQNIGYGDTFAHLLEAQHGKMLHYGEYLAIGMLISSLISTNVDVFTITKNILEQFECIRPLPSMDLSTTHNSTKKDNFQLNEMILSAIASPKIIEFSLNDLYKIFQKEYEALQHMELTTIKPQFVFYPSKFQGQITLPVSKSLLHRYLLAASLSDTTTKLTNIGTVLADDIKVTIKALQTIGATIIFDAVKESLLIHGTTKWFSPTQPINMGESGTSLRLLLPLLIHKIGAIHLTGEHNLPSRPLTPYLEAFDQVTFSQKHNTFLPLFGEGVIVAKNYKLSGAISSQFISGLLFVLPLLSESSSITLTSPLQSLPYVKLTVSVLEAFNIQIHHDDTYEHFQIPGNQQYITKGTYTVEPDYSARCFWDVANTFPGNKITFSHELTPTLQGDALVQTLLANKTHTIDIQDIPDAAPILALYLSQIGGSLVHTQRLKFKESNRLEAICAFLNQLHLNFTQNNDILYIQRSQVQGGNCDTFLDHRITMTLAIAATLAIAPIYINEIDSPNKSYAHFIADYKKIGGIIDEK